MKNRGVGAGLHPARDAARDAGRALLPPMPTGGGSQPGPLPPEPPGPGGSAPAAGVRVGEWLLQQDPASGGLVARHEPSGLVRELAAPPTNERSP